MSLCGDAHYSKVSLLDVVAPARQFYPTLMASNGEQSVNFRESLAVNFIWF